MSKPKFLYTLTLPFGRKELCEILEFARIGISHEDSRNRIYEQSHISWEHFDELEAKLNSYLEKQRG